MCNMSPYLVEIVVHAIKEKYLTEKAFYNDQLGISPQSWDRWKKGEQGLKYENMQIISTLFTDYEWMLVQKIVRQAQLSPDFIHNPVAEYIYLKQQIAKTWLQHDLARIEWKHSQENELGSVRKSNMVILRLVADYQIWGYSDIIEMRLPGVIQNQIGHDQRKLLQWVNDESAKYEEADQI